MQQNNGIENYIIYEDEELLVCHKPAGVAVQSAGVGVMDLESILKNYLAEKDPGKVPYIGVVHRLDQPVEGVIVFAKTRRAAKELDRQIAAGETEKYYLAVTGGRPPAAQGVLENYLKKDGRTNTSAVVKPGTAGAKCARLSYELLEEARDTDGAEKYLLLIHLETGRHHQIRVQMAAAGMALAGDRKYNPKGAAAAALGLCSAGFSFKHPKTGKKLKFTAVPQGAAFENFEGKL